ncbi:VOC family protein [Tateyamaria sp. syn59]|uniref:VOC family protein n=1 Tax=Tateyamaria sp. syn59 TaxID=2576942 RepID=UPI0011BF8999|nr:VOC family protein [Tateyamaria sp. syn59]
MIEDIHHIQLAMPKGRENEARAFYVGVLQLSEVEKPDALRKRGGVWFESNGVRLHLGVEDPFVPAKKAHPGFRVKSLDQTIQILVTTGVAYRREIDLPDITRIYVDDPFGNRIELLEVISA